MNPKPTPWQKSQLDTSALLALAPDLLTAFLALWECYQRDEKLGAQDLALVRKIMDKLKGGAL